jgi:hypothetical protein
MSRLTIKGEVLFGEARDTWEGSGTTLPIDIGKCMNWCAQFGIEDPGVGGTSTVQAEVSAGDAEVWVPLGDTYPIEDGTMLMDKQVPYRFVRFNINGVSRMRLSGTLTMAFS